MLRVVRRHDRSGYLIPGCDARVEQGITACGMRHGVCSQLGDLVGGSHIHKRCAYIPYY